MKSNRVNYNDHLMTKNILEYLDGWFFNSLSCLWYRDSAEHPGSRPVRQHLTLCKSLKILLYTCALTPPDNFHSRKRSRREEGIVQREETTIKDVMVKRKGRRESQAGGRDDSHRR
ncbi:hypothetical protein E2C01_074024 [Portunus trituberculatus]|uniref:Uncharacterized protein n=1 Tax=Portunus trituberculatus TaxID=210409 RepID=A0A5B7IBA9_PORTR|nr:hypothetical protein [Portunus trituberculatus]